jgi:hypothetical protein
MAMLFSHEAEDLGEDVDLSKEAWNGENPDLAPNVRDNIKVSRDNQDSREKPSSESPAETRARFNDQLEDFLSELGTSAYAERCSVATMVQALAFPLLVCVRGNERGWLPPETLVSIATRVVAIMFTRSYGREKPAGLFKNVQQRYCTLGLYEEFLRTVGDGTLWSALLAALAGYGDQTPRRFILQADALASVISCKELLAFTTPDSLDALSRTSIIPAASEAARGKISTILKSLTVLNLLLKQREAALYAAQGNGRRLQSGGSILWSSRWGWRALPVNPAQAYCAGDINVDLATKSDPELSLAISDLSNSLRSVLKKEEAFAIMVAADICPGYGQP